MKYTADRGHNYATLLPRCLSQNCFLPRPSSAHQLCCGADTRRQSVENAKMYGILWLLPCHDRLVCPCLSVSVSLNCWKTETEQQSRNVVTRAEGGIVRLSQAGDLGAVWPLCGSSLPSSPTGLSISRQSAQQAAHYYYCWYLPSSGQ